MYAIIVVLFVLHLSSMLIYDHKLASSAELGLKVKLAIFGLLFEKLGRLDIRAAPYTSIGQLTDNITTDMIRIFYSIITIYQYVIAPVLLLICCCILLVEVGVFALAGVSVIALLIALIMLIGKIVSRATQTKMRLSSLRNKETTFAISGIKSVKFNCWEEIVHRKIMDFKRRESKAVFTLNALTSVSNGFNNIFPSLAGFVTVLLYNYSSAEPLSLARLFFVLAIFNGMNIPLKIFSFALINLEQMKVSLKRLEHLLKLPDTPGPIPQGGLSVGEVRFSACTASFREKQFHRRILEMRGKAKTKAPNPSDIEADTDEGKIEDARRP